MADNSTFDMGEEKVNYKSDDVSKQKEADVVYISSGSDKKSFVGKSSNLYKKRCCVLFYWN